MADVSLSRKLQVKPGKRVAVLYAPPGYLARLGNLPGGVQAATELEGQFDIIQAFFETRQELATAVPALQAALAEGGFIWVSYPKQTSKRKSDLNRDVIWADLAPSGLCPVAQVAIDDTWSALRFKRVP
jgi:hypothetical protein